MNPIDWEQFENVVELEDPECWEIYDEFAVEVPGQLEELREISGRGDHAETVALSHRLRGGCLTFGLSGIGDVLTSLEATAKAGGDVSPDSWYEQAVGGFEAAQQAVTEYRAKHGV